MNRRLRACICRRCILDASMLAAAPKTRPMSKAFTRESDAGDDAGGDDEIAAPALPAHARNYMTPAGYRRLRGELMTLLDDERPKLVEVVSWAAKNGDRSENGDYLYGKKRLREIDRRIRFLTAAGHRRGRRPVGAPRQRPGLLRRHRDLRQRQGEQRTVTIKGIDEADSLPAR
jgi:transcription elongation factor GreB